LGPVAIQVNERRYNENQRQQEDRSDSHRDKSCPSTGEHDDFLEMQIEHRPVERLASPSML
jgi:hypothetical protein